MEFLLQLCSRFLHEWIAMSAAFENAGFEAAGAMGHFAAGDLLEQKLQVIL